MLNQTAATKDGRFIMGDSYRWSLQFVNRGAGTPVDLTGITIKARLYVNETTFFLGDVTLIDLIGGKIAIDFTRYAKDLPIGEYHYSILAIDESGYSLTLVRGCIEVADKTPAHCCEENLYV